MSKRIKIALSLIVFLLLLVVGVVLYYHKKLPEQITRMLEQELSKQLDPDRRDIYSIEIEEIKISLTPPQIIIPRISIQPNDHVFTETVPGKLPSNLISLIAKDISISADGIIAAFREREEIVFRRVVVFLKDITLFGNPESTEKTHESQAILQEGIYGIRQLELTARNFTYKHLSDTAIAEIELGELYFSGNVQHGIREEAEPGWRIADYLFSLSSVSYFPGGELYSYHIENLDASSDERAIHILKATIKPNYDKKEFQQQLKYQTDRMDVSVDTITLEDFNPGNLLNDNTMTLSGMSIHNAQIGVYRDRNLPLDTLRRPLMPTRLMRTSPVHFFIPEIALQNIDVIYSELPQNGTNEGTVPITKIDATIRNFTNITDSLQKDSLMRIMADGRFFKQARLRASFEYNLQDLGGGYSADGELSELDFTNLNNVLTPLLKTEVKSGVHTHTNFSFSGNDIVSTGTITMLYNGLELQEPDRSQIRRSIVGWAGRNIVYYPSNPHSDQETREGAIEFERDPSRFVFHYWWNCYLSGIKTTVLRDNFNINFFSN